MQRKILACALLISLAVPLALMNDPGADGAPSSSDVSIAADSGEIRARIVDEFGKPHAGVEVELFTFELDGRRWRPTDRSQTTDQAGIVRFNGLKSGGKSYLLRAQTGVWIGLRDVMLMDMTPRVDVDLKLTAFATVTIRVRDAADQPLAGAQLQSIEYQGSNGQFTVSSKSLASLCMSVKPGGAVGDLLLPALPSGGKATVKLVHPDCAPYMIKGLAIKQGTVGEAVLSPGVRITFRVETDGRNMPAELAATILPRRDDDPSSYFEEPLPFGADGTANVAMAAGDYSFVRLRHPDFYITPNYHSWQRGEDDPFRLESGHDWFGFQIRPKVKVRGRVINELTGAPQPGGRVTGELRGAPGKGPFAASATEWTSVTSAEVDSKGEYELLLAEGPARVDLYGDGFLARSDYLEFNVAADGSTTAPDLLVQPMPKIRGVVKDVDGHPVPRAVVRLRGETLRHFPPVSADDQGRFEVSPPWIPVDPKTEKRRPAQPLVAFHPYEPQAAKVEVRLDDPASLEHVVLRLASQDFADLAADDADGLSDWERGVVSDERRQELAGITLAGKKPPELDGSAWLNSDKPTMSLADFRGKYVLLDFWTTWCGPCHADMPSVKLVHELYKDRGVVVIGVHDNSMPLEAIKADVAKQGMTFPIVVDHADGRILTAYGQHGISAFPSYVLVGPDGTVIHDDDTMPGPRLRTYKIELIRKFAIGQKQAKN